ncbi:hypothetical protein DFQ28_006036 [Apophysomyces sp. BC1034]|nr:hypothetical protein DFQ30_006036 [Apophysomyces sp. BC1015]KAG0177342.1 hypothetical protein DFQ29_004943 [Apophysomyces sp. BC1021]KAG0187655.1 hypothetical protein DFQ28_006036 [Apophysomyces sp. BC1034]
MYATRAFQPRSFVSLSRRRLYSTEGGPNPGPSSNNGMIIGLIAIGGLGYYLYSKGKGKDTKLNEAYNMTKEAAQDKAAEAKGVAQERIGQVEASASNAVDKAVDKAEALKEQGIDAVKEKGQEIGDKIKEASK